MGQRLASKPYCVAFPLASLIDHATVGYGQGDRDRHLVLRVTENEFVISQHRNDLSLETTIHVPEDILETLQWSEAQNPLPLVCRNGITAMGIGRTLLTIGKDGRSQTIAVPEPIVAVTASPQGTRLRFVLSFRDGGGAILWYGTKLEPHLFGREQSQLQMQFTRTGKLIAAGGEQGDIYETTTDHLTCVGRFELSEAGVMQILPGSKPSSFFVCYRSGLVEEMECP